jgi:hypothetical protein
MPMILINNVENARMNNYKIEHHCRRKMAEMHALSLPTFFLEKGFASFNVGSL